MDPKAHRPRAMGFTAPLLDAQNFWDHWDLLCPEATVSPTTDETPLLETDTILHIEEVIWDTVQTQYRIRLDEIFYDATNCFAFFQTETAASIAQRGHDKAGRDAQRQVGLALAATRVGGFPLLSLVYRGNGHDAKLLPESMTRLIHRIARLQHDAHHLVLIFDRGNNSRANFDALMALATDDSPLRVDVMGGLVTAHHRDLLAKPLKAYSHTYENLRVWTGTPTACGGSPDTAAPRCPSGVLGHPFPGIVCHPPSGFGKTPNSIAWRTLLDSRRG